MGGEEVDAFWSNSPINLIEKGKEINHGRGSPNIWTYDEAHV